MSAQATKKTEHRTELAWVQLQQKSRTSHSEPLGLEFLMASETLKLFIGDVSGVPCVFVERTGSTTGRIPLSNVGSFGVVE